MIVSRITNHVEQALARLLQQYQGKPNLAALITAFVNRIQEIEDALFDMNQKTLFFDGSQYPAAGAQLDGIGEIVGAPRNGLTDAEYLVFIIGQIAINNSDGSISTMLNIINIFFEPTLLIAFNTPPAEFSFEVAGSALDSSLYSLVAQKIQQALKSGVRLGFIATCDPTNAFRYSKRTGLPAVINFSSVPVAGFFSLNFGTKTTPGILYTDDAATVQAGIAALTGLSHVTVTGSFSAGFSIDWGVGAIVPIVLNDNTLGVTITITDSVVIAPGTGGGFADRLIPNSGGVFASTIYAAPLGD